VSRSLPPVLNLPNLFTLARLALVPFILWAILSRRHAAAAALFVAAAVTDSLDGALARGFGRTTRAGAYLDPMADKVLLSGVFLGLAAIGSIPVWFVALVFGRDLAILAGAAVLLKLTKFRSFSPSRWGKASTFAQIATAALCMSRNALAAPALAAAADLALWPAAILTLVSGIDYAARAARLQ